MKKFNYIHKDLAEVGWQKLTFFEQLGNIGSEVGRTRKWKSKDAETFNGAFFRALDLFDLTLNDARWKGHLFEIDRARELFCDAAVGRNQYKTTLEDLEKYFMQFALAVNK